MKKVILVTTFSIFIIGCNSSSSKLSPTTNNCVSQTLNITPTSQRAFLDRLSSVKIEHVVHAKRWHRYSPRIDTNIAYKEHRFVAFSNPPSSKVLPTTGSLVNYSEDGLEWHKLDDSLSTIYTKLIVANDYFYAIGKKVSDARTSLISRSKNGYEWENLLSLDSTTLMDIAYLQGRIVVVGTNGLVASSNDGLKWSKQNLCQNSTFYTVSTNGNSFIITGDPAIMLSSSDAKNWNIIKQDIETIGIREGVETKGKSLFIANQSILLYKDTFLALKKASIEKVIVYKNQFLGTSRDKALLSSDGIHWKTIANIEMITDSHSNVDTQNFILIGSDILFQH